VCFDNPGTIMFDAQFFKPAPTGEVNALELEKNVHIPFIQHMVLGYQASFHLG
jgi:hypothetical protein